MPKKSSTQKSTRKDKQKSKVKAKSKDSEVKTRSGRHSLTPSHFSDFKRASNSSLRSPSFSGAGFWGRFESIYPGQVLLVGDQSNVLAQKLSESNKLVSFMSTSDSVFSAPLSPGADQKKRKVGLFDRGELTPSRVLKGDENSPHVAHLTPNRNSEHVRMATVHLSRGDESYSFFVFQKRIASVSSAEDAIPESKKRALFHADNIKRPASSSYTQERTLITSKVIKGAKGSRKSSTQEHGGKGDDIAHSAGLSGTFENSHVLALEHGGTKAYIARKEHNSLRIAVIERYGTRVILSGQPLYYSDVVEFLQSDAGDLFPIIKKEKAIWDDGEGNEIRVTMDGGLDVKPSKVLFSLMNLIYTTVFQLQEGILSPGDSESSSSRVSSSSFDKKIALGSIFDDMEDRDFVEAGALDPSATYSSSSSSSSSSAGASLGF